MFFKKISSFLLLFFLVLPFATFAQEEEASLESELSAELKKPEPKIDIRSSVRVNDRLFIDGSTSVNYYPDSNLIYLWELGNGYRSEAKKFQFIYEKPGIYNIKLKLQQYVEILDDQGNPRTILIESSAEEEIFVYKATSTIIVDANTDAGHYANLNSEAINQNFYFSEIEADLNTSGLFGQERLANKIKEKSSDVQESELIIIWSDPVVALNALNHFGQLHPDEIDFSNKTILLVSDGNLNTLSRIAEATFLVLNPKQIIFTREAAINEVLPAKGEGDRFIEILGSRGYEYLLIDKNTQSVSLWNFFSYLANKMIARGVSSQIILYLLMLPVIATIIAFCRQVIGLSTMGVYVPILMTLTFIFLGLGMGLLVLLAVIIGSLIARFILRKQRLLYTPKMSLALSIVALVLFAFVGILALVDAESAITLSILPVLVLATLAEKITALESGKSTRDLLILFAEITFVAILAYFIVGEWRGFQTIMRAYPELVFVFVVSNYFLGRFAGLRLFEYFRFRALIRELVQREEEE